MHPEPNQSLTMTKADKHKDESKAAKSKRGQIIKSAESYLDPVPISHPIYHGGLKIGGMRFPALDKKNRGK